MNNKQWQIGAVKIDGQAILAPMAGVSDIAYRLLAKNMVQPWYVPKWSVLWALNIRMNVLMNYCALKRQNVLYPCKFWL